MQLGDILDDLTLDVATGSIEITRVDIDSRECEFGSLFFSMADSPDAARANAIDAVGRGALCVVSGSRMSISAPLVTVPASQLRALCAHASSMIVRHPQDHVQLVGVTGTNGKTTVTTLVAELALAIDWNGANIGTMTNVRTTPASPELFRTLASIVAGFDVERPHSVVSLEVSSHAIDQRRIEGLRFAVACFTNLSHDHLDYHGSMEAYFATKAQLFTPEYAQRAVIWTDDPYGARLSSMTALPVTEVSRADAIDVVSTLGGTTFFWRGHLVNSEVIGGYNVDNMLLAMTILSELGADDGAVASAMSGAARVPGRFDVVRGRGITVVVDYAHTPEGLRRLLHDVRELVPAGRVITVFGCGGDRDREKRPEMGRIASEESDITFVTSDNPRSEPPDAIIDAIMSGVLASATVHRVVDRRDAIARALDDAMAGDVVVLAGKGHEATMTIADTVIEFNDRAVAQELLR
jgi:UDP-N-acetylmuramoyl-L-alanyl-D-glutamate--2,6-diaminopimelate ligase